MTPGIPNGIRVLHRTIVVDPPWEYSGFVSLWPDGSKEANRDLPYSSMSLYEMAALPIGEWADADCNLFLWTTNRYLPFAFPLLDHWGFDYRQTITWAKTNPAPWSGSIAPHSTEFLLVATRGRSGYTGRLASSVVTHRRLSHSEKPEVFLDLIESVSPGPYLEMFARRNRLGWNTWGNESLQHIEMGAA